MQKKLIALALASLAGSAFAQTNVTVYGTLDGTFEWAKASGATNYISNYTPGNVSQSVTNLGLATPAFYTYRNGEASNVKSQTRLSSNSSLLGFKGVEDLGNGLKALFQLEMGVDFTGNNDGAASGIFNGQVRDSFIGLTGGFGTVVAGTLTHPIRAMGAKVDFNPGASSSGFTGAMYGQVMGVKTGTDERARNAVAYVTPNFSGFTGTVAYVSGGVAAANDSKNDALNSAQTGAGNLYNSANGLVGNVTATPAQSLTAQVGTCSNTAYNTNYYGNDVACYKNGNDFHSQQWQVAAQYENGPLWLAAGYHDAKDPRAFGNVLNAVLPAVQQAAAVATVNAINNGTIAAPVLANGLVNTINVNRTVANGGTVANASAANNNLSGSVNAFNVIPAIYTNSTLVAGVQTAGATANIAANAAALSVVGATVATANGAPGTAGANGAATYTGVGSTLATLNGQNVVTGVNGTFYRTGTDMTTAAVVAAVGGTANTVVTAATGTENQATLAANAGQVLTRIKDQTAVVANQSAYTNAVNYQAAAGLNGVATAATNNAYNDKLTDWRLAGKYAFGSGTTISALWDQQNYKVNGTLLATGYTLANGTLVNGGSGNQQWQSFNAKAKRTAWMLGVNQNFGKSNVWLQYARANDTKFSGALSAIDGADTGANQWTIGASYDLSKRTQAHAFYTELRNKSFGNYDNYVNGVTGAGGALGTTSYAGTDTKVFGAGLRHSF